MMVSTVHGVDLILPRDARLLGASIDTPLPGQRVETAAVNVWGWVLSRAAPIRFVEIVSDNARAVRAPISVDRQHVADEFPDVPHAARSGFAAVVNIQGPRRHDSLVLRARLADGSDVTFGAVRLSHEWCSIDLQVADLASVIICSNGDESAIAQTVSSISRQTYARIERIVARSEQRPNLVAYESARLRNTGVRGSNGDFLLFVEAGVILEPTVVRLGVDALRHDTALAAVRLCGAGEPPGHDLVLYRRAALRSAGYFREDARDRPDRDLLTRLKLCGLVGDQRDRRPAPVSRGSSERASASAKRSKRG